MKLPNCDHPLPDEHLYSYLFRMLELNGLDLASFYTSFVGSEKISQGLSSFEAKREFLPLYNALSIQHDAFDFFMSLTTYPFTLIFLTPDEQTHHINNFFRDIDPANSRKRGFSEWPKICPLCYQNDIDMFGKPYYHRVHQIQGIKCCLKHNVRLRSFIAKKNVPITLKSKINLEEFADIDCVLSEHDIIAYAHYAEVLLNGNINSNYDAVRDAVREELLVRGYSKRKDRDCFFNDLYSWDHSSLLTVSKEQLLKWVSAHSRGSFFRFDIYNTLCLLMFLFQDPLELISKIRTDQPLIERHVCSKCKTIYHVTPLANKLGWGCPACEKGKTLAERDQMAATILLNKTNY